MRSRHEEGLQAGMLGPRRTDDVARECIYCEGKWVNANLPALEFGKISRKVKNLKEKKEGSNAAC